MANSRTIFLAAAAALSVFTAGIRGEQQEVRLREDWELGPFLKLDSINPILEPRNDTYFFCPVRQKYVLWEEKDVFNPTAIVRQGQINLIYRAEDRVGEFAGTSRVGLATSDDGLTFNRRLLPIFYPDNDTANIYEWEGGCEDPRIVEDEEGTYFMTYTAYNGSLARLMVASSKDLHSWTKHGPIFRSALNGKFIDLWSKSGSIVTSLDFSSNSSSSSSSSIAVKINGSYYMYWGDKNIHLATSPDLINWSPLTKDDPETGEAVMVPIFSPRPGKFDSDLVEPGPQAILRRDGTIWMIYNSRNKKAGGDPELPDGTYSAGQILFNATNPSQVLRRSDKNFFKPDKDYEIVGQVNNVVFLEGLVYFKNQVFLYYGTADSKIATAVAPFDIM